MLEISVWSSYFNRLSPEEAVLAFKEAGLRNMELSRDHGQVLLDRGKQVQTANDFLEFCRKNNFSINQGHICMKDVQQDKPQKDIDILKKWIEFYKLLNIQYIVVHIGKGLTPPPIHLSTEEIFIRRVDAIRELLKCVEGTKYCLCIENLVANVRTGQEMQALMEAINSPNLGVCYDTGHLNQVHKIETQENFINCVGKWIKAIHINDNDGMHEQHILPYSQCLDLPPHGVHRIEFDEVLRGLKKINFSGTLNFELPGESEAPIEILRIKLEYIKRMGEYMRKRMETF